MNNWGIWMEMKKKHHKDMIPLMGEDGEDEADLFEDGKKDSSGIKELMNNPNVKMDNVIVDGERYDKP
jgi:hypothetical protein